MTRLGFLVGAIMCTFAAVQATAAADEPGKLVTEFVAAFNAHDVGRMLTSCAADIRWMSVAGDKLTIETAGIERLAEAMRAYFRDMPSTRSELRSVVVSGNFVTAIERATWESKNQRRSQCSISVYEVREGRIQSVWYFPVHGC